jgi:hypothetical protein
VKVGRFGSWIRFSVWAIALGALAGPAAAAPDQDLSKYMGADCARMADAINHANRQTTTGRSLGELRRTYAEQCAVEEAKAREYLRADKRRRWEAEWAAKERAERQARQEISAARNRSAQCEEMQLALENRRKRAANNPGEQRDLQLFEQRFRERCG